MGLMQPRVGEEKSLDIKVKVGLFGPLSAVSGEWTAGKDPWHQRCRLLGNLLCRSSFTDNPEGGYL